MNGNTDCTISVIVPVYNVEKYLRHCLDSILSQSYEAHEIICVNDGSTDKSGEILETYQKKDGRIKVINQKNSGLSAARNTGIRKASGEYLCFVDSDDMLADHALLKMWRAVTEEDVDIVNYETAPLLYEKEELKDKNNKDDYYKVNGVYPGVWNGRHLFTELMKNNDFVESAWLLLVRAAWLESEDISFVPGMLFEDSVFALQCFFRCKKMLHIKEKLYIYRIREQSIMTEKCTFRHQYSRIWQFSECLRLIYTLAQSEDEVNALASYGLQCLCSARYINSRLEREEKEKMSSLAPFYGLLVKAMNMDDGSRWCNRDLSFLGLMHELRAAKTIIIYGAGVVGNKVKRLLQNESMGSKILGFAVTRSLDRSHKDGLMVKCIHDYKAEDDIVIVVAARENYHRDMISAAHSQGFKRIVAIDYEMERVIDETLDTMEYGADK